MAKLTKQEAAANARKRRLTRVHAKEYTEALRMNQKVKKADEKIITYQNFEARVKYAQKELKLMGKTSTRKAAIKAVLLSTTFMSREALYMQAIRDYMNVGARNKLRYALSKIKGTKYKQTTIDWSEFSYSNALQAMVHVSGKLLVRIAHGKDSTEPDFIEIVEM